MPIVIGHSTTHATLLARLADASDTQAWRDFAERYRELIYNFARRRGLQPEDCEDVLQDVMLQLAKTLPEFKYDPAKGRFRSYLKTITLHTIFRRSRQNAGESALQINESSVPDDVDSEALWDEEWRQHHLRQAMRVIALEFNATDQRAFEEYAVAGREARAVAEAVGMSVDQVYQAKSRILRRLTEVIDAQVAEEG